MNEKQSENFQSDEKTQSNKGIQLDINKPKYTFYKILGILVAILLIAAILYFVFSKETESSVSSFTDLDEENNPNEESKVVEGFTKNDEETIENTQTSEEVPGFS